MGQLYLLFICTVLDAILIPQGYANSRFTVSLFGFSMGFFEMAFWGLIVLNFYAWLPFARFKRKRFIPLTRVQILGACIVAVFAALSVALGLLRHNTYALSETRTIALFISVFATALRRFDMKDQRLRAYFRRMMMLFAIAGLTVLLSFFVPSFANAYSRVVLGEQSVDEYGRSLTGELGTYGLSMPAITMLPYFIGLSNLLFGKKAFIYHALTAIGLVSTNIFLQKPIVIAFLAGNLVTFFMYVYLRRSFSGVVRVFQNVLLGALGVYVIVKILPPTVIDAFARYFNYAWLNIGRAGVEEDLSSGRLKLFADYGSYALRGFGFAPWGIGKALATQTVANPHNFLIYLSYEIGIIPMVAVASVILSILTRTMSRLRAAYQRRDALVPVTFGIVAYLATLLIQGQYGGTLDKHNTYIFFFYTLLAVLAHVNSEFDERAKSVGQESPSGQTDAVALNPVSRVGLPSAMGDTHEMVR